jgi:hypothetical protein
MEDVHAGHALQALMDPTVSWGTLGTHLAAAKGARGARAEGFSSSSLRCYDYPLIRCRIPNVVSLRHRHWRAALRSWLRP